MVRSSVWRGALERTAIFTVVSVAFETTIGLGLAVMLNRKFRGRGLLRAWILIPWAVPTVVSATLWKTMLTRERFRRLPPRGTAPSRWPTTWLAGEWTSWASILTADA